MKPKSFTLCLTLIFAVLLNTSAAIAQNLEVEGKAKIAEMPADNAANQIVVKQADGTLAVRESSTLSGPRTGNYGTVVNPVTGKVWLDRNLGATQVADSSTDVASYGDLYQWGRGADGHQLRTSGKQGQQATTWLSGQGSWDGKFISQNLNWLTTEETDLWSGTSAENNPCPSGFRLPTNAEWNQERLTWPSNDAHGAFASPLKLPMAGVRDNLSGYFMFEGVIGIYWSSTIVEDMEPRNLYFYTGDAYMTGNWRSTGMSIRCIQD